jgi:hypothetical protein
MSLHFFFSILNLTTTQQHFSINLKHAVVSWTYSFTVAYSLGVLGNQKWQGRATRMYVEGEEGETRGLKRATLCPSMIS